MNENNQPQSQQKTRLGCTTCNGAGQYDTDVGPLECGHCGGTGYIEYDSEPSHSPAEQPGDSKWKIEYSKYSTHCKIIDADGYVGTIKGREKAELIARAPAILSEVSTLRSKQDELVAEMNRMKHYNLDAKREMASLNETIITLEAELEQLRSERDKMRELLKQTLYRFEDEQWFPSDLYDKIWSALSGGSKQ